MTLEIPAIQEAEIRRIVVQGQPTQKVSKTPSQLISQVSVMGLACNPTMQEAVGRRILVQG
jgi:hypothetical protein